MPSEPPYFVRLGAKIFGPFDLAKLEQLARDGQVRPDTPLRRSKDGPWTMAGTILEIECFRAAIEIQHVLPAPERRKPKNTNTSDEDEQVVERFKTTRELASARSQVDQTSDEPEIPTELGAAWHRDPIWRALLIGCGIVLVIAATLEFRRSRHASKKDRIQAHLKEAKEADAKGETRKVYDSLVAVIEDAGNYEPDNDAEQQMIREADRRVNTLGLELKEELDLEAAKRLAERQANREAWLQTALSIAILAAVFSFFGAIVFLWNQALRERHRKEGIRTQCPACSAYHAMKVVGEIVLKEQFRPKTVTSVNVFFANDGDLRADGFGIGSKQVIITVQEYVDVYRCRFCSHPMQSEPMRREIQE